MGRKTIVLKKILEQRKFTIAAKGPKATVDGYNSCYAVNTVDTIRLI